jgi:hypothetical protein
MLRNRMAGRLEGTHTFLHNHRPEAQTHRRFLDQVDLTTEQRGEPPTQSLESAKMVEPPDETPNPPSAVLRATWSKGLPFGRPSSHPVSMIVVTEAGVAAIRAAFRRERPSNRKD